MQNYDVLFMANHYIMVTTIQSDVELYDNDDTEDLAWKRLADEYGDEWVTETKSHIKQVSVEETIMIDDSIPEPGDPEDAGIDR